MPTRYLTLLFTLLATASFAVQHFIPSYLPTGKQLLNNNSFSQGSRAWEKKIHEGMGNITIEPNLVTLSTYNQPTNIQLYQNVDVDKLGKQLLFKALVKSNKVVKGDHSWNKARILLLQYVKNKPVYTTQHQLVSLDGTTEWKKYTQLFSITPHTEYITIKLLISKATGEFQCSNLSLYDATPNPLFSKLRIIFLSSWGVFCIFLFTPYLQNTRFPAKLAILLTLGLLVYGITMNVTIKNTIKTKAHNILEKGIEEIDYRSSLLDIKPTIQPSENNAETTGNHLSRQTHFKYGIIDITKIAHFLLFFALSIHLKLTKTKTVRWVIMDLALIACMTEILQLFVDGRYTLIRDVAIDLAGGLAGLSLSSIFKSKTRPFNLPSTHNDA